MRRRILLAILLAVTVTAAALGIPLGVTAWELVHNITRDDLSSRAERIAASLNDRVEQGENLDLSRVRLAVRDDESLTVRLPGRPDLTYGAEHDGEQIVERVELLDSASLELAAPVGPLRARQTQVTIAVLLLAVLSVGTGTVVAGVTARRLVRPLHHVAERAALLGAGDFRPDPQRYDVPELDQVAETLDSSASALASLVHRERQLVGDVSHQLRSRLTAVQLRLDSLTMHSDAEVVEDAGAAQEQADQLAQVLDELLAAARAARESGAEPLPLSTTLPRIAEEWRAVLQADGRTLKLRIAPGLMVRATPARLREVIGVLLDNAKRHGAGPVTLSARPRDRDDTVVIQVSDTGPGIPDALVPHMFDRGVSGAGSTGVGLALARALVEADGGRLELSAQRPATFSVFLRVPKSTEIAGVDWPEQSSPR
ncbi:HAMP domain-containing histidine kinase [Haloechinothrix sp. YIM 98757]|uniref:Signal transduction histidine-protein kinase/phosphatase MprB n=1 Tax=Haloechinothrix aidingensis TaxID=2752311 RepID=A0A838AFQ7_9PSEU|nr:HAMP domain-containing histidine kinase [Haloechinothrix aidingensis]